MQLYQYNVGPFAENTYLLTRDNAAILVDPGFYEESEFNECKKELASQSGTLQAIVLTHAHVDHILGLNRVLKEFEVPVYLSDKDRYLWENYSSQAQMFGFDVEPIETVPSRLPISENWKLGPFTFDVRYTPGHAPDHVVLYLPVEGKLIAGDTLFREGIGRTDLYKGDFNTLEHSIRTQLYSLPDDTEIYPGHGPKTTVGHEKANNPFIKG
ncbi:MBL fold metallo-hydrolase [Halalkalibaculum sp. DA3122]|uniref:MBL fold metallo-hydrolase n=1 Tax=unclassified Halalkalibaculum TaxID=2964617 RepID=UPI00375474BA